jgi:hypothetical protein
MGNFEVDVNDPQITNIRINKYLDKTIESMVLKLSLSELFEINESESFKLYDKMTDKVIEAVGYSAASIWVFNRWEEFEMSKTTYDKVKEIYIYVLSRLEDKNCTQLELEFEEFFIDIMDHINENIQ